MGLDIYLQWTGQTEAEHQAQITGFANSGAVGYLRSSYNSGGFNSWAKRTIGGRDFYWIFGYSDAAERETGEVYEDGESKTGFYPDWQACRARAQEALTDARKLDRHYTIPLHFLFGDAADEDSALAQFHAVADPRSGRESPFGGADWFSNSIGEFFLTEPPIVKAAIPVRSFMGGGVVLVCEMPEGKNPHEHYISILESVLKFIDLGENKHGWLHWSG